MNAEKLKELIRCNEGLKLDFKREYKLQITAPNGVDKRIWQEFVTGQWDEIIKDIIALTNGNVGTAKETAYLIIGVGDQLRSDGFRELYDSSHFNITRQQILQKVNSACYPHLPNLVCEFIKLEDKEICVISIPPSPHVHETSRQLKTTKGRFDHEDKLRFLEVGNIYSAHTAFVRRGEDIFPATNEDRKALAAEKNLLTYDPIKQSKTSGKIPRQHKPTGKNETRREAERNNVLIKLNHAVIKPLKYIAVAALILELVIVIIAVYIFFLVPDAFVILLLMMLLPIAAVLLLYPLCFSIIFSRIYDTGFYSLETNERHKVRTTLLEEKQNLLWLHHALIQNFVIVRLPDAKKRKLF